MPKKKAVILVSGGLDSATVLAIARDAGYECYTLSFDYGQRHRSELAASDRVSDALGAKVHKTVILDLRTIGGSALTDAGIDVPEEQTEGIPVTYVPARNTVFLSIALGWAEVLCASDIWIGVNAVDYSGYPDCRPEFVKQMDDVCRIANYDAVEIFSPYLNNTKIDILTDGLKMGLDYSQTWTCYNGRDKACGKCGACQERLEAFALNNVTDPIEYE